MVFFLAIPAILAALAFRWLHRRWFNPATIFLGILGIQLALYGALIGPGGYAEPSTNTLIASGGGLIGFLFGYVLLLVFWYPLAPKLMASPQAFPALPRKRATSLFRVALVCTLVALVWHAVAGMSNLADGGTGVALLDLRTGYLANLDSFSLAPHVAIAAQFLLLYLYLHGFRPKLAVTLFLIVSIGSAIWKVERSAVMMAGYSALLAYEMRRGRAIRMRWILASIVGAVGVFILTAVFRDGWENATDALGLMADYLAKNIQNFNSFVIDQPINGSIELVLGKYATVFGAAPTDLAIGQDEFFNTYSYLRNVYLYGGLPFCFAFGVVLGALSGALFLASKSRPLLATFYCFASFALFLSFFDYAYSWTNWAYYAVVGLALSATRPRLLRRRRLREQIGLAGTVASRSEPEGHHPAPGRA
jgi:oligosaccharide repeat unit polymerase